MNNVLETLNLINGIVFVHIRYWASGWLHTFVSRKPGKSWTRMWTSEERDGHPAEYRWRPLFNAAKFGWLPLPECRSVTLSRRETRWNWLGCPKLPDRSQPLVGRSSPYCGDTWRRYCCLTSFFPIINMCLNCKDMAQQSCSMVPRWPIFGDFLGPAFLASRVQHISDLHSRFALGPHHVSKYGRHLFCDCWD